MNSTFCNATSISDLVIYDALPQKDLYALVSNCTNYCILAVGWGNPDLAGIGVLISYFIQLGFATLFGPVLYLNWMIRALWGHNAENIALKRRLDHVHKTVIWTNLVFCMSVVVAACVRQYQTGCETYERQIICQVIGVTLFGFLVSMSSYRGPIGRVYLFGSCTIAIYGFSLAGEVAPSLPRYRKIDNILQACMLVSREQNLPWARTMIGPYVNKVQFRELFSAIAAVLLFMGMWLYLRRTRDQPPHIAFQRRIFRLVAGSFFVIVLGILGFALRLLIWALQMHLGLTSFERSKETEWGVGQIAALFAWTPLVVDMAYCITQIVRGTPERRGGEDASRNTVSEGGVGKEAPTHADPNR